MQRVFEAFSKQAENQIRSARKVGKDVNLSDLYSASQAHKLGLINGLGRINEKIPKEFASHKLYKLQESSFERLRSDLRKLNIWWLT